MKINKRIYFRVISIFLVLVLSIGILSGCEKDNDSNEDKKGHEIEAALSSEEKFDNLMDEIFADWVSGDALSMNYYLANPESMGIERPDSTFGDTATPEQIEESKKENQETRERLADIKYEELRSDQQVVYDILQRNLEISSIFEREDDFNYYTGYVRPLIGFQVQLPVLLAEFSFYTADDIERYLGLIGDTQRYFDEMIDFERERSRRGFFLSNANVDSINEHIESFLENREDNLLITVFNDRIDDYPGLSDDLRLEYKERNKELVLGNVLAAYDTLLDAMQELRGVGVNTGGLAALPNGSEYAHALLRTRTGSDKTPQELDILYAEWMDDTWQSIFEALMGVPDFYDRMISGTLGIIDEGTPKQYISDLQKRIAQNFPTIGSTGLDVLEVHESLQEHMSPAFYLMPAIDRFNENVVYINPASLGDNLFLYTVLAHESYPGHMYQTVYFLQQSPHPVRMTLSNSGYTEGWAVFAEMESYYFALEDPNEARIMWEMRLFDMLLVSYIDLGVNVLGWDYDDVTSLLALYNITSPEHIDNIYNRVTGIPMNSIMYTLGFIELMELMEDTRNREGASFELIEFNRSFLDFGPAPFSIIRKHW